MHWLAFGILGLVAGFLGGAPGVGGGVLLVPVLIVLFGYDAHVAIGTSLGAVILNAIAATWRHGAYQNVDWSAVAVLGGIGVIGVIGAVLGAVMIQRVPDLWAKRALAVFLVAMAIRLWPAGSGS
jgi:uncharacterized membrane protein YfcA